MTKKIIVILAISVFVFAGCSKKSEKIIGKWNTVSVEVPNADEVTQKIFDYNKKQYENAIEDLKKQIATANDSTKPMFEFYLNYYEKLLQNLNLDTLKKYITQNPEISFEFKKDSAFTVFSQNNQSQGTWNFSHNEDSLNITVNMQTVRFSVKDVTTKTLKLNKDEQVGDYKFQMTFNFEKAK